MLVCWLAGTNDLSTKHLMFQVLYFFTISCKFFYKNCINLFFLFDPANQRTRVLYCRLSDFYFWLLPLQWKWHCLAPLHIWFTPNIWTGAELKPKDITNRYILFCLLMLSRDMALAELVQLAQILQMLGIPKCTSFWCILGENTAHFSSALSLS